MKTTSAKESTRRWRQKNLEKYKETQRRWREKNRKKLTEKQRIYRDENRERMNEVARLWHAKNKERINERNRRNGQQDRLKQKYRLSLEQYEKMVQSIKRCPVCRHEFDKGKHRICVDHCHSTDVVRGLLCKRCNAAEGYLGSVENAERLYKYMLKNELFYQGRN